MTRRNKPCFRRVKDESKALRNRGIIPSKHACIVPVPASSGFVPYIPYTVCPYRPSTVPVPSYYYWHYTGKYFCGPIPFYYRDSGTSNLPANIFWPSIVIRVPIIYQLIASGPVPFSYRDTDTRSITANSFWTGAVFLLEYWYPQFTDKYLLAQYHFTASTPVYIS